MLTMTNDARAFVKKLPKEIALLKPSVTRKHTHSARVASSHVENESGNETISKAQYSNGYTTTATIE